MAERRRARFKVLDDGDPAARVAGTDAEGAPAALSAVAATLRKARMASGQDLREVADRLRIRRIYLQAIEEGRFADLPGPAYAVGFVRTLADHLGLDAEEIVRRFKEEVAEVSDLDKRTDLTFPEPVSEGRAPTVPILLIAVLLAAAVYGGWYYYTTRGRVAVERV
ncbi:MAG: helix-turn-helix domain-containing protein, partial [Alphaproteobacteria bacterium]